MMEWFQAGGFGMFAILALGAGSIGFGVKALGQPTAERLAILRGLPGLVVLTSLFAFGTNMWAVCHFLTKGSTGMPGADAAATGLVGLCEASQALTLGALMATIVVVLRLMVEAKKARIGAA